MLSSTMATRPGLSVEIEIEGRTTRSDRQALYRNFAEYAFTLQRIAKAPLVRVALTLSGPHCSPAELAQALGALRRELPAVLRIDYARLEWSCGAARAKSYGVKLRIEARELVMVRQELSHA